MGQSRHLFVYFRPFLITTPIIQLKKVHRIWTHGRRMVGADETKELWRQTFFRFVSSMYNFCGYIGNHLYLKFFHTWPYLTQLVRAFTVISRFQEKIYRLWFLSKLKVRERGQFLDFDLSRMLQKTRPLFMGLSRPLFLYFVF